MTFWIFLLTGPVNRLKADAPGKIFISFELRKSQNFAGVEDLSIRNSTVQRKHQHFSPSGPGFDSRRFEKDDKIKPEKVVLR